MLFFPHEEQQGFVSPFKPHQGFSGDYLWKKKKIPTKTHKEEKDPD